VDDQTDIGDKQPYSFIRLNTTAAADKLEYVKHIQHETKKSFKL